MERHTVDRRDCIEEPEVITVMMNMMMDSFDLNLLPVPVFECSCGWNLELVREKIYSNYYLEYIRMVNIHLKFPSYENSLGFREFFEQFNLNSRYQNRVYGVCELDFSFWLSERDISRDLIYQLNDFIHKNKGTCVFLLSNVSSNLCKILFENNMNNYINVAGNSLIKYENCIEEYLNKFNINLSHDEYIELLQLVVERDFSVQRLEWCFNRLAYGMYQGRSAFEIISSELKEYRDNNITIGFSI